MNTAIAAPRVLVYPDFGIEFFPEYEAAVNDNADLDTNEWVVRRYLASGPISDIGRALQPRIDALLQALLDADDVRNVFRRNPSAKPNVTMRDQNMAMEILVLYYVEGIKKSEAKQIVCDAFHETEGKMDMRTVQIAFKRWADDPAFARDRVFAYAEATKRQRASI